MKKIAIIASGYFNPIHRGHLEFLNLSKKKGDILIVIVNNDHQRKIKGSKEFMKEDERVLIIENIKCVDKVYLSSCDDIYNYVIAVTTYIKSYISANLDVYLNLKDEDNT